MRKRRKITPETCEDEGQGTLFSETDEIEKKEYQVCPECMGLIKPGEECKCGGIGLF